MAESILRLKVSSEEYDQKIKRAAEGIQQYAQKCRDAGGTLEHLGDGVLEFVQALGQMDTVAKSSKQQLREMSNALTTLTATYRGLTDEEKAAPFGQELARGIDMLTERAGSMQDAMMDVQQSIRNAASDTRQFDQVAGAMQAATAGFQTVTGAAKLMGIQMGDDVEVIAKLQAAMAVTTGFQTMQNLLQKQSALMQGVNALQKEFNILAKANPYVLLATAAAAVVTAYVAWTSGARDAEKAQKALNGEIEATKIQLDEIDRETNFNVAIAEAAGKSADAIHKMRVEAAKAKFELADANWYKLFDAGASKEQLDEADKVRNEAWKSVMAANDKWTEGTIQKLYGKGSGNKSESRSSLGTQKEQTEEQLNSAQIEKLTQEYITATDQRRQAIEKEIATIQKRNDEIARLKDMALGKAFDAGTLGEVSVTGNKNLQLGKSLSQSNISQYISNINSEIQSSEIGSTLYDKLTERLADANAFKNLLTVAVQNGIDTSEFNTQELWKKIVGGGEVDDSVWQNMQDQINDKLKELGIEPIKINFETGGIENVKKGADATSKSMSQAASAISSVGSALQQIEDPTAKVIGIVAQAIATVAAGYATATTQAASMGPWAWIAFGATGLAQMLTMISTIHSATGYAEGGIVKGNTYSGDMIQANDGSIGLNAGEVVLNHAQQGVLASQLQGVGGSMNLRGIIRGEDILVVADRSARRQGKGELLFWK